MWASDRAGLTKATKLEGADLIESFVTQVVKSRLYLLGKDRRVVRVPALKVEIRLPRLIDQFIPQPKQDTAVQFDRGQLFEQRLSLRQ